MLFSYVASNIELYCLEQAIEIFLRQELKVMLANLWDLIANDCGFILCVLYSSPQMHVKTFHINYEVVMSK